MPDATETTNATETTAEAATFEPITSQADLDKIIGARVAREKKNYADYDALKAKAEKFDAAQDAAKTEAQKLQDRLTEAEARAAQAETKAMRAEVARDKGVPASALHGATREELEACADELLAWRGDQAKQQRAPKSTGSLKSGVTSSNAGTSPKERAAAALRELRQNS